MTCRHGPHDPACGSYARGLKDAHEFIAERERIEGKVATPDAERFEVVEVEPVGSHLVMKIKYPSCAACAYEGEKVMVFLNTTLVQAIRWRKIDPHFREGLAFSVTEAPSPAARFPGSHDGWVDATAWARGHK